LCNIADHAAAFGTIDGSHPAFIDREASTLDMTDRQTIVDLISEVENAIALLKHEDVIRPIDRSDNTGFTWGSTGRGAKADLKYWTICHEELESWKMGLPEREDKPVVDPVRIMDIFYGEAIYGVRESVTLGVPDGNEVVCYPNLTEADRNLIYRRGFGQPDKMVDAGLREVWASYEAVAGYSDAVLFGAFATVGQKSSVPGGNEYGYSQNNLAIWTREDGWGGGPVISIVNVDDADDIKLWSKSHGPMADHQWNDAFLNDGEVTTPPVGAASYSRFVLTDVPAELHRAALCATWNVTFVR
jgi:hypothetical protein